MITRRSRYDALAPSAEPRWLVSRSMHRTVIESRRLEPSADLVRTFLLAMLELIDAGWQVGEFSSTMGLARCSRGTERRMVSIEHIDPQQPERAHAS